MSSYGRGLWVLLEVNRKKFSSVQFPSGPISSKVLLSNSILKNKKDISHKKELKIPFAYSSGGERPVDVEWSAKSFGMARQYNRRRVSTLDKSACFILFDRKTKKKIALIHVI